MESVHRELGYDVVFFTEHDQVVASSPDPGLVVAMGEEVSAHEGHCNALGLSTPIPRGSWQQVIDEATLQGALVQVNHPSRYGHTPSDLEGLVGLWALEVKNHGQHDPSDVALWDSQLSQGKRLWGTFSDDAHIVGVVGRGWLMVNTPGNCSEDDVLANMRTGNFYNTEGPTLELWVSENAVHVASDSGTRIDWYAANMALVQSTAAAVDAYVVDGSEVFVRAVVVDSSGREAWTMPVFVVSPSSSGM
jgi:hypothetical protein